MTQLKDTDWLNFAALYPAGEYRPSQPPEANLTVAVRALRYDTDNVVTEAGTTRTITLDDAGKYIRFTNAAGCTVTLSDDSVMTAADSALRRSPLGMQFVGRRAAGAGAIVLAGDPTINDDGIADIEEGQTFALKNVATDTWDFI